jgi:hypothetical protein
VGGGKAGSAAPSSVGGGKAGSAAPGSVGGGKAGGPAAGSGGSGAASSSVSGATKLSEIETDAQAQAVCSKLRTQIKQADLDVIQRGSCALEGLTGELQGAGECSKLAAECLAEPAGADEDCTTADLPSCDVSVDEFLACAQANMQVSVAFFGKLTCQTDIDTLTEPATPPACAKLYDKCPELADGSDDAS